MDEFLAGLWSDSEVFVEHWPFFGLIAVLVAGLANWIGRGIGYGNLFRDDQALFRPDAGSAVARIRASPAFWSHVGLTALTAAAVVIARDHAECGARCPWAPGGDLRMLAYAGLAGLVFLLIVWRSVRAIRVDGTRPPAGAVRAEMVRRLLGFAAGLALSWLAWALAGLAPADLRVVLPAAWRAVFSVELPWFYLIGAVGIAAALGKRASPPCLALTALMGALILIGGVFMRLKGGWDEGIAGLIVAWIVYANGGRFKLRIPGFPDPENPGATLYDRPAKDLVNPNARKVAPERKGSIAPTAALDAWLKAQREDKGADHKPKLALLCTSGGAYRASFWTSLLLDHLRGESGADGRYAGLVESIRLVTGASGGMVAGAYFVALAAKGDQRPVTEALMADIQAFQTSDWGNRGIPFPRDSLTPVARRLVRSDLPSMLRRRRPHTDRGRVLEDQWLTLRATFTDIAEAERVGRAPSIIFSPMLVESGAPAFLTNLNLREMRERSLGFDEAPQLDLDKESVELFNAFPDAAGAMTLATAVRLNATFPYVSPAVSLPTIPRRRVVDAGYYDNYGVDLATAFLLTPSVKDWIQTNCAGVAVLEVRAFPSDRPDRKQTPFARAFQWVTSPLEGVFRARSSSQMFRNNQQLRLVSSIYDIEMQQDFVQSFVFEAAADASMSWYLPDDEFCALRNLLPDRDALAAEAETADAEKRAMVERQQTKLGEQLKALETFWNA